MSIWVSPRVVIKVRGRRLIAPADLYDIPQIHRGAFGSSRYCHVADALCAIKLPRGNESDPALACFDCSTRRDDVSGIKHLGEISRTQAVGREAILRVIQIDGLRQNAATFHLGDLGSTLQSPANQVREIVEFGV